MDILYDLDTVGTVAYLSGTHDFTCVNKSPGLAVAKDSVTSYRVYNTAPRTNLICLIVLSFDENKPAETDYYCDPPETFRTPNSCDNEED